MHAANAARTPLTHTHHPGSRQATFSPVRPDLGASTPPLPPVPLGLPPGGRLPRRGSAASPVSAGAPAPPGGGACRGRGHRGVGGAGLGAVWAGGKHRGRGLDARRW